MLNNIFLITLYSEKAHTILTNEVQYDISIEGKKDASETLLRFTIIGAIQLEDIATLRSTGAAAINLINLETSQNFLKRKHYLVNYTYFCASTYKDIDGNCIPVERRRRVKCVM